jgi:hypothetical protein
MRNKNDLLLVFTNEGAGSTIVDYSIMNGIVSPGQSWQASQPTPSFITSSFVRFSDNRKTAEFCLGLDCIAYHKAN